MSLPPPSEDRPIDCENCGDAVQGHNMKVTRDEHPLGPHVWVCPNCAIDPHRPSVDGGDS